MRVIKMGNSNPKSYLKDVPKPPAGATREQLRAFVKARVPSVDMAFWEGHPEEEKILRDINDGHLDLDYKFDVSALKAQLAAANDEIVTTIKVSPDSDPDQSISEIKRCWAAHSHEARPIWVSGNAEAEGLAAFLAESYKCPVRPWEEAKKLGQAVEE